MKQLLLIYAVVAMAGCSTPDQHAPLEPQHLRSEPVTRQVPTKAESWLYHFFEFFGPFLEAWLNTGVPENGETLVYFEESDGADSQ